MKDVANILRELKAESGGNAKIDILRTNKDNELLQSVFVATLDPYTQYYLRKIPAYKNVSTKYTLEDALKGLEKLSSREVTGHAGIAHLTDLLENLSEDDAFVLERVVKKNLDCGVQTSTVNKVWKNLIATYPCLLAKGSNDKNLAYITFPAYTQKKADGMRVNVFYEKGKVSFRGRSGKTIDLLGYLEDDFVALGKTYGKDMVFDGELVLVKDGKVLVRRIGNGILNKAIKGTISAKEAAMVRADLWDAIPLAEFRKGKSKETYKDRFETFVANVAKAPRDGYIVIETRTVNNLDEAQVHFEEMLAEGEEGIILKNMTGKWENKRSKDLVKMKAEKDADLVVVDWQEGTGKFAGMMGALVCQTSDGKVEVNIGSGYSDEQRKEFTKEAMMGRIVTVLYNERIASKARTDVDSLFLPRFIELREDKDEANSEKEVK
jgi:ATP-dependent DNA ligase